MLFDKCLQYALRNLACNRNLYGTIFKTKTKKYRNEKYWTKYFQAKKFYTNFDLMCKQIHKTFLTKTQGINDKKKFHLIHIF